MLSCFRMNNNNNSNATADATRVPPSQCHRGTKRKRSMGAQESSDDEDGRKRPRRAPSDATIADVVVDDPWLTFATRHGNNADVEVEARVHVGPDAPWVSADTFKAANERCNMDVARGRAVCRRRETCDLMFDDSVRLTLDGATLQPIGAVRKRRLAVLDVTPRLRLAAASETPCERPHADVQPQFTRRKTRLSYTYAVVVGPGGDDAVATPAFRVDLTRATQNRAVRFEIEVELLRNDSHAVDAWRTMAHELTSLLFIDEKATVAS